MSTVERIAARLRRADADWSFWMIVESAGYRPRALPWLRVGILALTSFASGCATLPRQDALDGVDALVNQRLGTAVAANRASRDVTTHRGVSLDAPLTAEDAVRVALLRNPDIQVAYARLGISRADVIEASRVANPTLSASALRPDGGGARKITAALVQPFVDLLLLSSRRRLATDEFAIAEREIAGTLLDLAADVERDWYRHVAARQIAAMRAIGSEAASASADLAQSFHDAGNLKPLDLALEKAAAAQARIDAARANAKALEARLRLARAMGVSSTDAWEASANFAAPVEEEDALPELTALARRQRVDLDAAQREIRVREDIIGTTRRFRWLGDVDAGVEWEREPDGSRLLGPTLDLTLPIFHQGQAGVARAEARRDRARAKLAGLELSLESDLTSASEGVAVARAIVAEYANALVPLREAVVARTQENVNFMLTGVFELLLAKREEYDTYEKYLEAVRDYWLARVELSRAIGGRLPSDAQIAASDIGVESILNPPAPAGGHGDHSGHAGHDMGSMNDAADPAPAAEDHSGHDMGAMPEKAEPAPAVEDHSGHDMREMKEPARPATAPEAEDTDSDATPDPHQGHQADPS